MGGFFCSIYCGHLVELLEVNLTTSGTLGLGLSGVLTSQSCLHAASSNAQLQASFPTLGLVFKVTSMGWPLLGWAWLCSPVCLFSAGSRPSPPVPPLLPDLRKLVGFSICSSFYLLGEDGPFQAPYVLKGKGKSVTLWVLIYIFP